MCNVCFVLDLVLNMLYGNIIIVMKMHPINHFAISNQAK